MVVTPPFFLNHLSIQLGKKLILLFKDTLDKFCTRCARIMIVGIPSLVCKYAIVVSYDALKNSFFGILKDLSLFS